MIKSKKIKAYIITGRNESLKNDFNKWLIKLESNKFFSGSYFNDKNEQPYIFKEKMIKKLRLDLYVEDNWDIVYFLKLKMKNEKLKIFWIYNILDRSKKFPDKFPNLNSVVTKIKKIIE